MSSRKHTVFVIVFAASIFAFVVAAGIVWNRMGRVQILNAVVPLTPTGAAKMTGTIDTSYHWTHIIFNWNSTDPIVLESKASILITNNDPTGDVSVNLVSPGGVALGTPVFIDPGKTARVFSGQLKELNQQRRIGILGNKEISAKIELNFETLQNPEYLNKIEVRSHYRIPGL